MQEQKTGLWTTDVKIVCEYVLKLKTWPNHQPIAVFSKHQTRNFFQKFDLTPPLGLRILQLFEDFKIDLDIVDDITMQDTPLWSQSEPHVSLYLTKF